MLKNVEEIKLIKKLTNSSTLRENKVNTLPNKENKVEEIPQFKGTREALNNLSIKEN